MDSYDALIVGGGFYGLYLAGGSAHPGPGMPMVLMSGWIAADTLDRDGVAERASEATVAALAAGH